MSGGYPCTCCSCQWLNATTPTQILGAGHAASGTWTDSGSTLDVSAAGIFAVSGHAKTYEQAFVWIVSAPADAVLRLYLACSPGSTGPFYIEWKMGSSGYLKAVGDITLQIAATPAASGTTLSACIAKRASTGTYYLTGFGGATLTVPITPAYSGAAIEVVSTGSTVSTSSVEGYNPGTGGCPSCNEDCGPQFLTVDVTIGGIVSSHDPTFCTFSNGNFTVTATGSPVAGCYGITGQISVGTGYDPVANQTTVSGGLNPTQATWQKVISGRLVPTDLVGMSLPLVGHNNELDCDYSAATMTITSVSTS